MRRFEVRSQKSEVRSQSDLWPLIAVVCLLVSLSLADGWVFSRDGQRVDRVAQPLPRVGVNLVTGQADSMRECDPMEAAMCGWYRVIPSAQPTNMLIIGRSWYRTNMVFQEVLSVTNFPEMQP
jgi:hypothetical protein